ncbi:hypothetical protein [Chitinophaga sp. RAB17]|uniref:hypothetical protein n=1 Tax=Chitinophaga sp. RAB17 TaxID=3233049 RepID=UPI003F92D98B
MKDQEKFLCPSARCKTGSELLGMRQEDGTVAILPQTLPVDETFIQKVNESQVTAEQAFRFTNKCVEGACSQWTGKSCGVIEKLVTYLDSVPAKEDLPRCPIRKSCRWFHQQGNGACKICVFVITEVTEQDMTTVQA